MPRSDHRRRPQQDRSRATVDAILEAAAEILAQQGPTGATTNRIAERAGVSVGSVYQYFANKKALYRALGDRFTASLRRTVGDLAPRMVTLPVEQFLPEAIEALLAGVIEDPVLAGMLHVTALPARDFEGIDAFERELEGLAATLICAHPALRARCPDPDLSARVIVRAGAGLVVRTLSLEPEVVTTDRFRDELVRLIEGYIGGPLTADDGA